MTSPLGSLRKYYWLCAIFALFFAAALILREIDSKDNPYHIFTSLLITIILESLVIWWGILTYSRITDRYIKKMDSGYMCIAGFLFIAETSEI